MAISFWKETMQFCEFIKSFFKSPDFVSSSANFDNIEGDMTFSEIRVFIRRDGDLENLRDGRIFKWGLRKVKLPPFFGLG